MSQQSFHRIIFKSTGLFGVSQFIKIAVKLISNKVAAIFLGTAGIGMIGLLENILALIQGFTSLGIASSSVREVALLNDNPKKEKRLFKNNISLGVNYRDFRICSFNHFFKLH